MTLTVAVTGATGFLGRPLCASLARRGHHVRTFVRGGSVPFAGDVQSFSLRDLADVEVLQAGCTGADSVVHLAARVHLLRDSVSDREAAYRVVNVEGTRNVLRAAAAAGVRRAVVLSSVKAVGESNVRPWTEDEPPDPQDPYGRSKYEMEQVALEIGRDSGMCISILRLPLVYGPGGVGNVHRLLKLIDGGWPLPLGSIRNRRSMIFIDNAVAAITTLLETEGEAEGVFFVSDGVDLSTPELIRTIGRALGRSVRLTPMPVSMLRAIGLIGDWVDRVVPVPFTSADVDRLCGSLTVSPGLLAERTGFVPSIPPEDGWKETARWFRAVEDTE